MQVSVYLPLLASLVLSRLSPWAARHLPPRVAARALTGSAVLAGLSSIWGLVLLAATLLVHSPPVLERVGRQAGLLQRADVVPVWVGIAASLGLAVAFARIARTLHREWKAAAAVRPLRRIAGSLGGLLVIDEVAPLAFALSGKRGGVVVSRGMLRVLSIAERRALLAHERSHQRHHHHAYLRAVGLASAANPLLRSVGTDVAYLLERWADEDAAQRVGRPVAARALARAALASCPMTAARVLLPAFERLQIPHRIRALQATPTRGCPVLALACLLVATVAIVAAVDATLCASDLLHIVLHTPMHQAA